MTPPKRKKREYTPEQKAAALAVLASCGGSTRHAARQLAGAGHKIPEATLRGWANQPMAPAQQELVDDAKRELDVILESVVGKIARGLDRPEAIDRILSKPVQAGTVLGILVDKLRVLRGQATEITEQRTLAGFLASAKWVDAEDAPKETTSARPN
jgi:hypothetical protein